MDIRESISIDELLRKETDRDVWIAHPGGPEPSCSAFLGTDGVKPSLFLIGPEGGFSTAEIALCEENGARLIGFPMPVMRTPVAVMMIGALGALVEMMVTRERADEDGVNSC